MKPQQLEQRKRGIGGTDISAIAGLNPWRNAMDVFLSKTGMVGEIRDNPAMEWGRRLEACIAAKYAKEENAKLVKNAHILIHPKLDIVIGIPDYLVKTAPRGLEIKTARTAMNWGDSETDDIPSYYLCQVAWYMGITGLKQWDVAALLAGSDYRVYRIHRDKEFENELLAIASEFWNNHILKEIPPELDASKSTEIYLRRKYATHTEALPIAAPHQEELLKNLAHAKKELKETEGRYELQKHIVQNEIGEASGIVAPFGKVTWRKTNDAEITDWKSVAKELKPSQELIAKYTNDWAGTRRFLVNLEV